MAQLDCDSVESGQRRPTEAEVEAPDCVSGLRKRLGEPKIRRG
jgi:hypothetical protein